MQKLKKHILFYCFALSSLLGLAQNPAHFYLGEDEFANTHIYSLKHHPNGLLYAATNYGLYVYKNGTFKPIPSKKNQITGSLFSLRLDAKNNLYCTNLSGEIFKLINDSLTFYTKIPEDYLHKFAIDLVFDDKDNMILRSGVLAVYEKEQWRKITPEHKSPAVINGFNPKSILFPSSKHIGIYEVINKKNKLVKSLRGVNPSHTAHTFPFYYSNQLVGINPSGFLLNYTTNENYQITTEKVIVNQTDDGSVWLLSKQKGIFRLQYKEGQFFLSAKYFKNTFISSITVSENGTMFLGTFSNGVIVIPDINCFEYKTNFGHIEGIASIPSDKISTDLKINIKKNKTLEFIPQQIGMSIIMGHNKVFYDDELNFGFNGIDNSLLVQDLWHTSKVGNLGALKDVQKVSNNLGLIATSNGLFKVGKGLNHINWLKSGDAGLWWKYAEKHFRCKAVGYISTTQELLYTNYGVLHHIGKNGIDSLLLFNGTPIKCSNICATDTVAICASQQDGVLFIKNGKVVRQLSVNDGLLDDYVKKIILDNNKLYITGRTTFQIYDLTTKAWENLGKYHNVIKGAVSNMLVANNKIFLTSKDKLLALPLNSFSEKKENFTFTINRIVLGDSIFNRTKGISAAYNKNNLSVQLDFRGLLYEKQLKIEYRLNNSEWKSIPAITEKIEFGALAPDDYNLTIRLNNFGEYSHHQNIQFTITPPFWKTWWFLLLAGIGIIFTIGLTARYRINKVKLKNKEKIEKQTLKTNLLDTELKALRSQMNPHFIFNSLNSIQDLILKEDTDGSYDYVVLFANLVRSTLNYSNKDFIAIEKELEFLEVYLKLEKLRFGDDFIYQLNYTGTEAIEVPSLIVQPFIENALIHGLLHKEGVKNLSISFELSDQLKCIITDNGVGRKRSEEIKERQGGNHESFALEAIKQRLSILSNKDGDSFGYEVTDLYDGETPLGTQIEITIPYKLLY